jgi:hypothetical protein
MRGGVQRAYLTGHRSGRPNGQVAPAAPPFPADTRTTSGRRGQDGRLVGAHPDPQIRPLHERPRSRGDPLSGDAPAVALFPVRPRQCRALGRGGRDRRRRLKGLETGEVVYRQPPAGGVRRDRFPDQKGGASCPINASTTPPFPLFRPWTTTLPVLPSGSSNVKVFPTAFLIGGRQLLQQLLSDQFLWPLAGTACAGADSPRTARAVTSAKARPCA